METVIDIFDTLGGPSSVARILGVRQSTASMMKHRKCIPVRWWPSLLADERAKQAGVDAETLIRIHANQSNGEAA